MNANDRLSVAIVKPVDDKCNMNCDYCYFKNKKKPFPLDGIMKEQTLCNLINFFSEGRQGTEFIWHGGEPLLAGMDFYKTAISLQREWKKKGVIIKNSIQTNATLINSDWVSFFEENGFTVGVSLDGPEYIHNVHRKYTENGFAFDHSMRGIDLLKRTKIFAGVLCCIHEESLNYPKEILDFFLSNEIKSIRFLRVKGTDINGGIMKGSITPEEFHRFLLNVFKYWIEINDPDMEIINFKSPLELMMGGDFRECSNSGECGKYATIYSDGSVYACDTLAQTNENLFGNVNCSREKVINSIGFKMFYERHSIVRNKCQSCEWRNICNTGCLADWEVVGSNLMVNRSCEGMKLFFSETRKTLKSYELI